MECDMVRSSKEESQVYHNQVAALRVQMNSISGANNLAQEEFRQMTNERDQAQAVFADQLRTAEQSLIRMKAEGAQETLSALQAQASDGYASVQELEVNAQRRADEAFKAFKDDVQREATTIIHDGLVFHEQIAADAKEYSLQPSDEANEFWAEARAAEHSEQRAGAQLTQARAQSQQRLMDKDSWIQAHRQLSQDAQVKDRALREEASRALAEQQVLFRGELHSAQEDIMQEVRTEWEISKSGYDSKINELTLALSSAQAEQNAFEQIAAAGGKQEQMYMYSLSQSRVHELQNIVGLRDIELAELQRLERRALRKTTC
jgi:hypothetical protein